MTTDVNVKSGKGGYVDVVASGGAVSSVDATGCTGLTVTGGPITTSGTLVFTLGTELQALSLLSTTGLVTRTAANTYVQRSIAIGSSRLTLSNGSGVSGNPTLDLSDTAVTPGSYVFSSFTVGQDGRVTSASSGSPVTSVSVTGSTGLTVGGSPITTTGTITLTLGTELQALSALSSTGLVTRTAANTYAERSIAIGSANLTLSNGSGVSGNPTVDLATTLSGLTLVTTDAITINNSPTNPTDGTNKSYVDLVSAGFEFKSICYCATTANLNAIYLNGVLGVGAKLTNAGSLAALVIDGQSLSLNARVLVKDQNTTYQNGIYTVTTVGSGAIAWVLTRATDYDTTAEIQAGDLIPVQNGTINFSSVWLETAVVTTVGTDPLIFTQFAYSPSYFLQVANNLSDLTSQSTARNNLGLTNVAIQNVTNHSALVGGASNAITSIALTNGQLLIGSTSSDPVAAAPTNGTNISWTTGAGSLTANISGQIALTNGGTNASLSASNGGIFYSTASAGAILSGTATANQVLLSGTSAAPSWSTATYPATTTINQILYSSAANTLTGLATGNSGALITSSGGVPSISSTLPSAVQGNITSVGTISSGTWNGSVIDLSHGGTNANLTASNGGILYSTASAGAILAGTATANKILLSGSSTTPAWSTSTIPSSAGSTANVLLISNGTNYVLGALTYPNSAVLGDTYYASSTSAITALAGNTTSTKKFLTQTGAAGVSAAPGWNTIVAADVPTSNLTGVNDTNVTIAIGTAACLLASSSLTMGWSGQLSLARGGTNASLTASNGGIFYSTASAGAILSGTATANQLLLSGASGAPAWSTVTHPATTTINQILYSSAANVISGLATGNSGVLITSSGGVPSISSTLPSAVQGNITSTGTIASGTWNGSNVDLSHGGTNASLTASNGGIFYSTASAGAILSGTATANQILLSGTSAAPSWSTATYPATTTINQILYSSSANTVAGLATGNNGVLITSATGVPSLLANGTTSQVLIATTGSPPSWSSLSAIGVTSITGTASQVLANGTSGSAQIGAVTLALAASVSTTSVTGTSSVTGGNVSLGAGISKGTISTTVSGYDLQVLMSGAGDVLLQNSNHACILKFYSSSLGNYIGLQAGTLSGNTTFVLPTADGGSGDLLKTDGSGNLGFVALSSIGVTSITGTANQVIASASTGAVTLSLPQSIATSSSVQFGTAGINVAPVGTVQLNVSSTLAFNTFLRGTQTSQSSNLQCGLVIQQTFAPAARITGRVAAIFNNPTITVPNVTNPAISEACGEYITLVVNGTAGKRVDICYGIFVDSGTLTTATVTNSYGGYFSNPGFGTNQCGLYADSASIGYTATTPPSNGLIVSGNVSIGSSSATSLFNVGSSNQFQIGATGIVTSGTWNGTTIAVANGGTGATSTTAYSVICGGTTSTGALQSVASVGTLGQVLNSNGASALPTWVNQAAYYSNVITVQKGGNDGTGARGGLPFLTITAALAASGITAGDMVLVYPGTYSESGMTIPNGVSLAGTSSSDCIITTTSTNTAAVYMGGSSGSYNCRLQGFTIIMTTTTGGSYQGGVTFDGGISTTPAVSGSVKDVIVKITETGAGAKSGIYGFIFKNAGTASAGIVNVENCKAILSSTGTGAGIVGIYMQTASSTIVARNCELSITASSFGRGVQTLASGCNASLYKCYISTSSIDIDYSGGGTISCYSCDGSYSDPFALQYVTVTLTQSQIKNAFATPITIVPTLGSGFGIIVQVVYYNYNYHTAAFTAGGSTQLIYSGGASATAVTTTANSLILGSASSFWSVNGALTAHTVADCVDQSVQFTNITGAFTGGNASSQIVVQCWYRVVPIS